MSKETIKGIPDFSGLDILSLILGVLFIAAVLLAASMQIRENNQRETIPVESQMVR